MRQSGTDGRPTGDGPNSQLARWTTLAENACPVLWELLEFSLGGLSTLTGTTAVLAQRGASDVALDLFFDAVGGVLVATLGAHRLRGVASALADRLGG